MERALVAPDGTSLFRPMHPSDAVMISRYQSHHIVADHLVFVIVHIVDSRDV
jgi:hypothetical protein